MEYLFILGRNPQLSIEELKSFFVDLKYQKHGNAILAEIPQINHGIVKKFGGIIAIGEVLAYEKDFKSILENKILFYGSGNKLNYTILDFSSSEGFVDVVRNKLKVKFKEEGLKATEKRVYDFIKLQSGDKAENLSSKKLIDEQYFVFGDKFGRIIETCDYEKLEKEDMEKPIRREMLAISPRLAKIMINLSQTKRGETLVDPFCGIGVILQEALRREIKVVGIDKDSKAIDGLKKNLKWGKFSEKNYKIINGDSTKARIANVASIVTEPDLGEIFKKIPNDEKTSEILHKYENLMIGVLNNLKQNVLGRIVFTGPFIQTSNRNFVKRRGCNIGKIVKSTGLKLVSGFPVAEFRENQIVGREIFVFDSK